MSLMKLVIGWCHWVLYSHFGVTLLSIFILFFKNLFLLFTFTLFQPFSSCCVWAVGGRLTVDSSLFSSQVLTIYFQRNTRQQHQKFPQHKNSVNQSKVKDFWFFSSTNPRNRSLFFNKLCWLWTFSISKESPDVWISCNVKHQNKKQGPSLYSTIMKTFINLIILWPCY